MDKHIFHCDKLFSCGFDKFSEMKTNKMLCDVAVKVGDKNIECHKNVLASSIPYFYSMFMSNMVESTSKEICINDVDSDILEMFIDFAYTGKIEINLENVENLIFSAAYLQIQCVQDECLDFITKKINPNRILQIYKIAETFKYTTLIEMCLKYTLINFETISNSDEFLNLAEEELLSIIKEEKLHDVIEEQIIFENIMKWIDHDETNRSKLLPTLSKEIQFKKLTPKYLVEIASNNQLIKSFAECRDLIDDAKNYHLTQCHTKHFSNTERRCNLSRNSSTDAIYIIGGKSSYGCNVSDVELYLNDKNVKHMTVERYGVTVAVHQNKLFAMGGQYINGSYDMYCFSSTVEYYDINNRKWSDVKIMNNERYFAGSCSLGENIYVCGGKQCKNDKDYFLSSVECYYPSLEYWDPIVSLSNKRSNIGVVSLMGSVWVLGGYNKNTVFSLVKSYDPRTSKWKNEKDMLTAKHSFGITTFNDKIYICGGSDYSNVLEEYDPRNCQWNQLNPMTFKRTELSLVSYEKKLYAIGGMNSYNKVVNLVEIYDPMTNKWSFGEQLKVPRCGAGAVVYPF